VVDILELVDMVLLETLEVEVVNLEEITLPALRVDMDSFV